MTCRQLRGREANRGKDTTNFVKPNDQGGKWEGGSWWESHEVLYLMYKSRMHDFTEKLRIPRLRRRPTRRTSPG